MPISKKKKHNTANKTTDSDQTNVIGIDFGCQTSLTMSDGKKINISFGESEQLKKLQRQLSRRKTKHSNRRVKLINKIRRQYERIKNKKADIANKIVYDLKHYGKIVIQDEQLANWKRKTSRHGKAV